jgi:ArsR family transcriptional regulator
MTGQNESEASNGSRGIRGAGGTAIGHSLSDPEIAADVRILSTLGNDTRYEALRLVAEAEDPVCVCELEPALGVSQSAVSQALSRLFGAGLVERRKEGRWRYYTATPHARRLLRFLDETRTGSRTDE